ncbi:hypothetical protein ASPZODRAFT_133393 [Penicilliopsis zonata CBS 506.65]|uniref:GST C-terminal domain-containing protein n=1 Tax=Penicilliopsis zonata CBS 506.65 TaxID=1073090 RepID=A0A1L9SEF3_9EURO|nr:hypothetical protein ASPZODRAFT_133393 [Penicilliopsis zonata CBS 506.65]OJJ45559.1 hypothetical protein ASPZODRAFT_133393 [Penicilliopsis zonata CBS 506.65]
MTETTQDVSRKAAPAPTLHHLTSSQSLRILWALEELAQATSQPFTVKVYQRIKGRAPPELQQIFPLGKSPILEIPSSLGETAEYRPIPFLTTANNSTIVAESRLILHFLSDHYAGDLWRASSADEQLTDTFFQEFATCTLAPTMDRIVTFDLIASNAPLPARPLTWAVFTPLVRMFLKDLAAPFALMEQTLASGRAWFGGEEKLGLSDFLLSWPMDVAMQRGYLDSRKYPRLAEWVERVHSREAYRRAVKRASYDLVKYDL